MQNRQRIVIFIGILISGVFLFLAFRGLKPEAFVKSLQTVNVPLLLVGAAVYFMAVALISWRWQFLLTPIQRIPLNRLVQLVSICYMGNNVYPLRAGEALRIFLLWRNQRVPVFRSTTITLIERVFDGIVMLSFILIGLSLNNLQNPLIYTVLTVAGPFFLIGLLTFITFALMPHWGRRIVDLVAKFLPTRLKELFLHLSYELLEGLAALQSPLQFFGAIFASYLSWMVEACVYWIVMQAFGFQVGYSVALLVVGTVNLAGTIAVVPGQIGVYEFFASSVLMGFAIPQNQALSYAIVVHIVIWLPITLVGFFFLAKQGLKWTDVRKAKILEAEVATP